MSTIKQRVNDYLDHYIGYLFACNEDAGWHQPSLIQRLMEYLGDLPRGSGCDKPDVKMLNEIEYLTPMTEEAAVARFILSTLESHQRLVLVASRYADRRNNEEGKRYTDAQVALELSINTHTFKKYKKAASERFYAVVTAIVQCERLGIPFSSEVMNHTINELKLEKSNG